MTQQISRRQIIDEIIDNSKVSATAEIASTKLADWSADRDANSNKLTNLANGTDAQDAVTKSQLEAAVTAASAGLTVKDPVRVASTVSVAGTYSNTGGVSARGQFTAMPNSIDGVSLVDGDRVLLKNQSTASQNGIWVVSTLGSGSNGVWDRSSDFDSDTEVQDGTFVFVGEGTQATTQWVLTTNNTIVIGGASGSDLTFAQFGAGAAYTADESTLTVAANQFSIRTGGVGTAQLGVDAVTQAKIADNAVQTEHILADAVTNAKIVDSAVTTGKINDLAVTGAKIAFIGNTPTGLINGSNVTFTLSGTPTAESLIVWVRGVRQRPTTDFTRSGAVLTFTTAPETDDDVSVFGIVA